MIFLEYSVIALVEAFYMFKDHNHVPKQQVHKRLQSDLKNLPKVKILKFDFLTGILSFFDVKISKM